MFIKSITIGVVTAFALTALSLTVPTQASAQSSPSSKSATAKKEDPKKTYAYNTREGDNYSLLARKALQTYGYNQKIKFTNAHIIAAETHLAAEAGFPELEIGQNVEFTNDALKNVSDKVQKFTQTDLQAWETYVPYVDFNTRDNG